MEAVKKEVSLPAFLDWSDWFNKKSYLQGVDMSLSKFLEAAFDLEKHGIHIANAGWINPVKLLPQSFEEQFLKPEMDRFVQDSVEITKAVGAPVYDLRSYFAKKPKTLFIEEYPFLGNGHARESVLYATLLANATGVKAMVVQPEDLLTGISREFFDKKRWVHKKLQEGNLNEIEMKAQFDRMNATYKSGIDALKIRAGRYAALLGVAVTGEEGFQDPKLNESGKKTRERMDAIPLFAKEILRAMVTIDSTLTEAELADINLKLINLANAEGELIHLHNSHPNTIRAFLVKYPQHPVVKRTLSLIPDSGFLNIVHSDAKTANRQLIFWNYMLETFALIAGSTNSVTATPNSEISASLNEVFNNQGTKVETGELLSSLTLEQLAVKWRQKVKNIAMMVNGNASNANAIRQATIEFIRAGCPKRYNLAICLFNKDFAEVFNGAEATIVKEALAKHANLKLVITENKIGTGKISQVIVRWAHVSAFKPAGENAFMDAAQGCLDALWHSKMTNEKLNFVHNSDKAIIANWPKRVSYGPVSGHLTPIERWEPVLSRLKDEELKRASAGFTIESGNDVVAYFDNLFAKDFAKNYAIDGYLRSNHLNSLHQMLVSVTQMITGEYSKAANREILTHMGLAQERFIEKLAHEMEKFFGFSYKVTLAKINSRNISSIAELDDPGHLANKYMNTLTIQTAKEAHERDIAERNKTIAAISLGAVGTTIAILLFNSLKQKDLKKLWRRKV